MIQVNNLHKSFGTLKALNGVSFTAPDGKITGLLGPNGAGKTTTLRILYTLLKPDQGEACIDGFNTQTDQQQALKHLGAVPDSHGLYPRMTAAENIRYYGELRGMNAGEIEANLQRLTRMLEMEDILHRRTKGFSSGQRVKVAIARALIHQPQNILLDEPTNGLDVMSTRAMRSFILRLREECKCVVLSSHIMQEVSMLCDHIVIINRGEIAACGAPEELLEAGGKSNLEDVFVSIIGNAEGLL
jgi:sodium transport system ATP-binding protein